MIELIKRFLKAKSNFFIIGICIGLVIVLFVLDAAFLYRGTVPAHIYWLREALVLVAFSLAIFVVLRRHKTQPEHLVYRLKSSFFAVLGMYITVAIPGVIISNQTSSSAESVLQMLPVLRETFKLTFMAVFLTIFLIVLVFQVRDFVLYKSKRKIHKIYQFGLVLFVINVAYGHYAHRFLKTDWSFSGKTPLEWFFFGLLVLIIVILSFRSSWVTYLNKRQKYLATWAGILLLPGTVLVLQSTTFEDISRFSLTIGTFNTFAFYFVSCYLLVSVLSLLLHLPTASIFDKKIKEIASLQNLSRDLNSVLGYDEVIARVTALTQDVLKSDSSWLEMNKENGELKVVSYQNLSDEQVNGIPLSRKEGVSGWIFDNQNSILVNDVGRDSRTAYLINNDINVGSLLGVPLRSKDRVLGALYAIKTELYGFDQNDREMLQAFADQATMAIENARLVEQSIEKERLEQELKVAQESQMKLLPKEMPMVNGLDIDAMILTAAEVGGDYFDFIELDDHRLAVVIADVSGKGLSAAFYMAELKGIVNAFAKLYDSPKELMQKINQTLYSNVDSQTFVTMIYAIFDSKRKRMKFCRAGHGPLYHYSVLKKKAAILQPPGIGVALECKGVFNKILEESEIKWHESDFFLFCTDGLNEARNTSRQEYGEQRIVRIAENASGESARGIRQAVRDDLAKFIGRTGMHDDLSLIVVKINP